MRGFSLTTDMDFRVIPSAIPLQSPSPDRKSINVITPTISPNAIQIKKGTTPIRNIRYQKENNKSGYQTETQIKYHSQHVGSDISSALKQKDDIIKNLRNVIDMITQNNRYKKSNQSEESDLKNQVKILTIQNQKLVNIIDKMSKTKSIDLGATKINQQYQQRIDSLMKSLKQNEVFHEQQTKQLKRFNKSLNTHCKNLESEKKQLQLQNKKLLAILKQRNEGEKKPSEKLKLSDASQNSNEEKSSNQNPTKNQQRLTLMKIRQQHSQNLKALKQGLIKQIEQTFDTMKIALDGINIKMTALSKRLESIQKMTWARVRKTHVQTQSITISIRQGVTQEQAAKTDRSYKLQKKHNSQIYIEEGPSSSHQKASRDQFSRLQQVSQVSQKNLINPLQQELSAVKAELHQLRFKYDKLCMDTSELGFSQRIKPQQFSGISERYKETMQQIGNKDKEINILYDQIRKIEEQNIAEHKKKDECIRQKQIEVEKIKQIHQQELQQIKNQTELKVKLLAQNYQKQIQLLHRQLMIKNANLNEASESIFIQKSEYNKKMQGQAKRAQQLQNQNKDLKQKLRVAENSLTQEKENNEKLYRNLEQQLKLQQQTNQNNRKKREQFERQTLLKISQSSQQKMEIQTLKTQLQSKTQQSEQSKRQKQQAQQNLHKQLQNNIKLRTLLMQKQNMIVKLRQAIAQWNNSSILGQINQIKQLLQKQKQQQSSYTQKHIKLGQQKQRTQKLLTQLNNLRRQNEQLRNQLISKDELTTQLQAKVNQLQNLYGMIKSKLQEQQQLHIQLMDRVGEYEKQISHIKIEKEQSIARYQSRLGINSDAIIGKVEQIRDLQIQRNQCIHRLFEDAKAHPSSE